MEKSRGIAQKAAVLCIQPAFLLLKRLSCELCFVSLCVSLTHCTDGLRGGNLVEESLFLGFGNDGECLDLCCVSVQSGKGSHYCSYFKEDVKALAMEKAASLGAEHTLWVHTTN